METSLSLSFYSQKKIYVVNSESEEQKSCAPSNENIEYEESDLGKPLKIVNWISVFSLKLNMPPLFNELSDFQGLYIQEAKSDIYLMEEKWLTSWHWKFDILYILYILNILNINKEIKIRKTVEQYNGSRGFTSCRKSVFCIDFM